jgi:RNA recognition motif-containing protein
VSKKIYCGNLSYKVSSSDLEAMFAEYGVVLNAEVIMDRATGQSKGFGFVEMQRDDDAISAIQALKDTTLDGRPLNVSEAKPRTDRSDHRQGGGRGGRRW